MGGLKDESPKGGVQRKINHVEKTSRGKKTEKKKGRGILKTRYSALYLRMVKVSVGGTRGAK